MTQKRLNNVAAQFDSWKDHDLRRFAAGAPLDFYSSKRRFHGQGSPPISIPGRGGAIQTCLYHIPIDFIELHKFSIAIVVPLFFVR